MPEPFVGLDAIFSYAVQETQKMTQHGFDLSDPYIVTPLGWYANKYPEIAERCNDSLMELINKQAAMLPNLVTVYDEVNMDYF